MRSLVLAVLLSAGAAFAQSDLNPPPRPPNEELNLSSGINDGLMLEVNVLGVNSFGSIFSLLSASGAGSTTATSVVNPSAALGYLFGHNAFLVNVSLLGVGPGTNVAFSLNPLFRHYFSALQSGSVSTFLQGGLTFGILSPASGAANYLIGLVGGAGAEWLFVKNIGLIVDVLIEYGHAHFAGGDINVDLLGFAGNVGVTVHW